MTVFNQQLEKVAQKHSSSSLKHVENLISEKEGTAGSESPDSEPPSVSGFGPAKWGSFLPAHRSHLSSDRVPRPSDRTNSTKLSLGIVWGIGYPQTFHRNCTVVVTRISCVIRALAPPMVSSAFFQAYFHNVFHSISTTAKSLKIKQNGGIT